MQSMYVIVMHLMMMITIHQESFPKCRQFYYKFTLTVSWLINKKIEKKFKKKKIEKRNVRLTYRAAT